MQATREETVNITLVLNKAEAEWLRIMMQNPLHGESIHDEEKNQAEVRMRFFLTLNNCLKGQ